MTQHNKRSCNSCVRARLRHGLNIISWHYVPIVVENSRGSVWYKAVYVHARNGCVCGGGGINPVMFNPGSKRRWVVTLTLPPLCTKTRSPTPERTRRFLRLKVGLNDLDKGKLFLSLLGIEQRFLGCPSCSLISIRQSCAVYSVWVISE